MAEQYTCELCRMTFEKETSDEAAVAEAVATFSPEDLEGEMSIVCDGCYTKFMSWYKEVTLG